MIPAEYAATAQSMGWRDALKSYAGGPAELGGPIIKSVGLWNARLAGPSGSADEVHDGFEVEGLGKQIDQMQLLDFVTRTQ